MRSATTRWAVLAVAACLAIPADRAAAQSIVGEALGRAVRDARQAAHRNQAMNNLKRIALAMHQAHASTGAFPAAWSADDEGRPLLSWRVHILPYLEQQSLYDRFRLDEPWDSEHNRQLIEHMPAVYRAPGGRIEPGHTVYLGIRHDDAILSGSRALRMADILDGTSNTVLAVEAAPGEAVPWTKPDDLTPGGNLPEQLIGLRGDVFLAAMADGSVRALSREIDPEMLLRAFRRNSGEPLRLE